MEVAAVIAERSNCLKAHVGAIIATDNRIRAVGYNGTVAGYKDCFDGGCERCRNRTVSGGQKLDQCVCVHAEQNALVSAARYGIAVDNSECWVTHEPCLDCTKLLIQSGIRIVHYLSAYPYEGNPGQAKRRQDARHHSEVKNLTIFKSERDNLRNSALLEDRLADMKQLAQRYATKHKIWI